MLGVTSVEPTGDMSGPDAEGGSGAAYSILAGGVSYFLMVFGVGFVLGIGRTLWLAPRFGERSAELVEAPFMLVTIWLAARWARRLEERDPVSGSVYVLSLLLFAVMPVLVSREEAPR